MTHLEVDDNAGAAYLTVTNLPVLKTVEIAPDMQVDLSGTGEVVGVECLGLDPDAPPVFTVTKKSPKWLRDLLEANPEYFTRLQADMYQFEVR